MKKGRFDKRIKLIKENIDGKEVELVDLGICEGRINEKSITKEELAKYLMGGELK